VKFLLCPLCTAARVINRISPETGDLEFVDVTSVGDELFLVLNRCIDQIAVYSTNNYKLLRHLEVPLYEPRRAFAMTSCVRRKCLYMSDDDKQCIRRYALSSSATDRWPLSFRPYGLSVTPNGNLLVTCTFPNKLVELSAESGEQVRAISLQKDIECLWHGIQLANGQFVVCDGIYGSLNRVYMVDDDGRVTRSYGGEYGSGDGQLDSPLHLAVDEDSQLIFVADSGNDRVVVLSLALEFVRYISEGIQWPKRLHLDQTTRRLYVAQGRGRVIVIQL